MIPRGRLDIGWGELFLGALRCLSPGDRGEAEGRVEALWTHEGAGLACLSVRTGFDLLLSALDYPAGTEILVSAINIRDMVRIVHEHGLVPVPLDLDRETLAPTAESLERCASSRTKAILVAHLFGSRMELDVVARFARKRHLLLIEDCAQSFVGADYRGHADSDISLFSFGPIKTATALGGALLRVPDPRLRIRMRQIQSEYPIQSRFRFLRRVGRFAALKLLAWRPPFTVICHICRFFAEDHDVVIGRALRGFRGPALLENLRKRPSEPLLALLHWRIEGFDAAGISDRMAAAQTLLELTPGVDRPGARVEGHTHWVLPLLSSKPDELVRHLWARGFDATRGAWSLFAVPAPPSRPDAEAPVAEDMMGRIVYLPTWPSVKSRDLPRLAQAVLEAEAPAFAETA